MVESGDDVAEFAELGDDSFNSPAAFAVTKGRSPIVLKFRVSVPPYSCKVQYISVLHYDYSVSCRERKLRAMYRGV